MYIIYVCYTCILYTYSISLLTIVYYTRIIYTYTILTFWGLYTTVQYACTYAITLFNTWCPMLSQIRYIPYYSHANHLIITWIYLIVRVRSLMSDCCQMARQCCQMMSESKGHFGPVSAVSILLMPVAPDTTSMQRSHFKNMCIDIIAIIES